MRHRGIIVMGAVLALSMPAAAKTGFQRLEVDTASGAHVFKIELMRSSQERARGLMDRKSLPTDQGMLFQFPEEQPVTFWMKDTYIPLDMVFIDHAGRVVGIKHDAKPMDETLIDSGAPTLVVLEVNAGVVDAIGLKLGDAVRHPMFHETK